MIMRIVLIFSDLLFKYFHIIADPEKLSRGRGSEGYLTVLGGVGGEAYFWCFYYIRCKFKKFEFSRKGGGDPDTPL